MPDTPIVGFSPQQETDLAGTGLPFPDMSFVPMEPMPLRSRLASAWPSVPPFTVAISLFYVLALLGTGLYFMMHN